MERGTLLLAFITLLSWGLGSFIDKLAANRIGVKSVFWVELGFLPVLIGFIIWFSRTNGLFSADRMGVALAILAGIIGSIGGISYYVLLAKEEATRAIPLTALYPALAVLLAFIFLHESITASKVAGIVLGVIAIYLLSL